MILRPVIFIFLMLGWVNTQAQTEFEQERKKGETAALEVEQQMGLVHIQSAEEMVKKVGDRLVGQLSSNPYQFSFQIVDQEEPNAFALPGGFVYVSRGLLMLLKNEDELAGVMGHEISHVMKRHSSSQQRKSVLPGILAIPAVAFGNTLGQGMGEKIASPVLGAGKAYLASYSRKQELEADDLGIALAAKAGYQPLLLANILNRLEKFVEAQSGEASRFSIFDDHPMTPDRMKAIQEKGASMVVAKVAPISPSPYDFLSCFNQILCGADPVHGTFNQNIFLHPGLKIFWELPKEWSYFNEATLAGAISPDHKTLMAIKVAGLDRQIDTLIVKFVNNFYATTRKKPMRDTTLAIPGRIGSEVVMPAKKKNEILYSLWFKKDDLTYTILGSGTVDRLKDFQKISQSFRDLQTTDYPLIQYQELLTIKSQAGESLETLSKRTQNSLSPAMTSILNEISEGYSFKKDEPVKVVLRKPYTIK